MLVIHSDCCVLYLRIHIMSLSQPAVAAADRVYHEIQIWLVCVCIYVYVYLYDAKQGLNVIRQESRINTCSLPFFLSSSLSQTTMTVLGLATDRSLIGLAVSFLIC